MHASAQASLRKSMPIRLACIAPEELMNVVSAKDTMADYSHILFNKNPSQLRLLGARGGRAYGRNQRARRALLPPCLAVPLPIAPGESTAQAVAALDARFPWLRCAEKRPPLKLAPARKKGAAE
jgi:hypothetical protein